VDVDSASRKLNAAALAFEGNSSAVEFADIGSQLAPLEFKIFLEKAFSMKLTTPEVGHYVYIARRYGTNCIAVPPGGIFN
jgi:hypothetical protein